MTIRALGTPWASPGERQYSLPTSLMVKLTLGEASSHVPTVRDIARGTLAAATSIDGGPIDRIIGEQLDNRHRPCNFVPHLKQSFCEDSRG